MPRVRAMTLPSHVYRGLESSPEVKTLEEHLTDALSDGLPRQRHNLARFMLDNIVSVAFSSAEEIGQHTGVSTSTVVRFARQIGYSGFPALKKAAQAGTPKFLTSAEKTMHHLQAGTTSLRGFEPLNIIAQDIRNLEESASLNAAEAYQSAVDRLSKSRLVYAVGFGRTTYLAEALAHQLSLLGLIAESGHRDAGPLTARLRLLNPDDTLVIIGVWRYTRLALFTMEELELSGPFTVVITDSKASPLIGRADVALIAATYSEHLTHSLTSIMSLVSVLASGVAAQDPKRTIASLEQIDSAYRSLGLIAPIHDGSSSHGDGI